MSKTESQVIKEALRCGSLANELKEVVDKIEASLSNVTTPAEKVPTHQTEQRATPLVALAGRLSTCNTVILYSITRLTSLLNRLEV